MKHAKAFFLLALCLLLAACGPKEAAPEASSFAPGISASPAEPDRSVPGVPEPDISQPDTSVPEAPAPLTEEDRAGAMDAAYDYYLGTVFEVHSLTEIQPPQGEIAFQVSCSKGGEKVDPDRTICLERKHGAWSVVSEGY